MVRLLEFMAVQVVDLHFQSSRSGEVNIKKLLLSHLPSGSASNCNRYIVIESPCTVRHVREPRAIYVRLHKQATKCKHYKPPPPHPTLLGVT